VLSDPANVSAECFGKLIDALVELLLIVEEDEIELRQFCGDEFVVHPAPNYRREPLVQGRSKPDLSQGNLGRNCVRAEHEHHGVCASDQRLDALPPFLECVDVGAVDKRLEAPHLQCCFQPVGTLHVLPAIGNEDLSFRLVCLLNSGISHQHAPRGVLIFEAWRQGRQAPPDPSMPSVGR
jgi:hypothetical protein